MEIDKLLTFKKREELREWLLANSTAEKYCWVIVTIKPKLDTLLYLDVVEEALCFGWIDGVKKKLSETQTAQRLSPRAKKSPWTELNKERVRRLEKLGLMTDEGRKILSSDIYKPFKIDSVIEEKLKEDQQIYENFMAFPDLYRRIRIDTIQTNKKDAALFESRLDKLIEQTKANKQYGAWHDNGRLIEESVE
ncbi:thymidylate synthase [Carnobacterium maltaromaticum]|uniref:YdeI/OmpD-associated family protein n=1 Tax=Carnobacterium maltaromaticum TaxID=2751 RepID=UPI000C77E4FC|nr:YdeI/OmpD-associated family protein [Carnobacterium maltaromaticum]PLS37006.1 thymidylate synthase [Carnobacterium maltaromaticum]PLS37820.1 thymidylate synthase [Carnobacterium maltaromaticum]PLS39761.1 thymidylate synthase [Carnobacterium maltaromaticum]PLS44517.1 thymidylate synthase [Carnobacterium maltaromaticum]PLS46550.1 thymidylate synthase [Carnobacterium maltaromaticum]